MMYEKLFYSVYTRDSTGQHFCSPACPDLKRNRLAQPVYDKLQLFFRPGPARSLKYKVTSNAKEQQDFSSLFIKAAAIGLPVDLQF